MVHRKTASALSLIRDAKSAVLLELLDHGVRDQAFDPREERRILEHRDRDAVDVLQIVRLDLANAISGAAAEQRDHQDQRRKCFHSSGVAVASGVGEGSAAGTAGASVVVGVSEAGGGSDSSASGGGRRRDIVGRGAHHGSFAFTFALFRSRLRSLGFFAVAAVTAGGLQARRRPLWRAIQRRAFSRGRSGSSRAAGGSRRCSK